MCIVILIKVRVILFYIQKINNRKKRLDENKFLHNIFSVRTLILNENYGYKSKY